MRASACPSYFRALVFCFAACLPVGSALPASQAEATDNREAGASLIKSLLPTLIEQEDMIGLAIAVVAEDRVLLKETAGVTRLGGEEAVTDQTVFRIASLSKGFAATLSALLVEQGAMGWDDVVATSVPVFDLTETDESKVTVETLLGQSTGLPHFAYDNLLEAQIKVDRILTRLSEVELMCPVGSCYSYQNVAFSAIAPLVEAKTGKPWAEVMRDTLFQPLGMSSATHGRDALVASSSWAEPHLRARRGWVTGRVKETYYRVAPASGINASLDDMVIWLKAQMGPKRSGSRYRSADTTAFAQGQKYAGIVCTSLAAPSNQPGPLRSWAGASSITRAGSWCFTAAVWPAIVPRSPLCQS